MATDVYKTRTKRFVTPFPGQTFKYGFATNISDADSTALGQQLVDANSGVVIFGAQSPKPNRAKKVSTNLAAAGVVTSFIDASLLSSLPNGWILARKARARSASAGPRSKAVFVMFSGYKYAWMMPSRLYTNIEPNLVSLGIALCSPDDYRDYVWGSNNFKPPRAAKTVAGGTGGADTYSTFYDPDKDLPTGWVKVFEGYIRG